MQSVEKIVESGPVTPSQGLRSPRVSDLNLHAPPSVLETERVHKRMKDDGEEERIVFDDMTFSSEQIDDYKIVFFLYQRGYTKKKYPQLKITFFLANSEKAKARDTLLSIIDKKRSTPASNLDKWKHWQRVLLRYLDLPNVTSFFQESEKRQSAVLMVRRQTKKNCFIHATLSAVAYMAALDSDTPHEAKSLDNDQVVRHIFDPPMLYNLVCKGGSPDNLLRALLQHTNSKATFLGTMRFAESCCADRPVVVTGFIVDGKIMEYYKDPAKRKCDEGEILQFDMDGEKEIANKSPLPPLSDRARECMEEMENANAVTIPDVPVSASDDGTPHLTATSSSSTTSDTCDDGCESDGDGNLHDTGMLDGADKDETHALLILGCRKDHNGKLWFLIQNTWYGMVLFEISAACLKWHAERTKEAGHGVLYIDKLGEEKFILPEKFSPLEKDNALLLDGGIDGWAMPGEYDMIDGI
jgi:hypothetical protein